MKSKTVITITCMLLFVTMINLAIHQVSVNQDKTIRVDAVRYVGEHCVDELRMREYGEWMVNNSEVSFNVSEFKK